MGKIDLREIVRAGRRIARSMPRWALPFYWVSATCVLFFAGFIWLLGSFCMSMRPAYEARR